MIRNSKDTDLQTKQEGSTDHDYHRAPISSRLWSGLKNPRIVRVSRAFGGKDRHSKVSTVRGLRDRRVRLSVPTAIQLYDLQDRLGLNQPSKVVDWLLNAAQHEIDKLPPLQLPSENFAQYSQPPPISHDHVEGLATFPQSTFWNSVAPQRIAKQREDAKEPQLEKGKAIRGIETVSSQLCISHEHQPKPAHSLLGDTMPFSSYYHWEAAHAYLSQLGNQYSSQVEAPSLRTLGPESQVVFRPSGIMPPMFPSHVAATATTPAEFDAKQFAHLHMAGSTAQNMSSNSTGNSLQLGGASSARPNFQ